VLFITHDFGVVAEIADRVAVLEKGVLVEEGTADQVLGAPRHAYTQKLLAAVPSLSPRAPALPESPPVLSVEGLGKIYRKRSFFGTAREVRAAEDISFSSGPGRDARPRRRVRLRQIDRRALLPAIDRTR
jgi:peptide/nickel transport system ATP-binding protein